LRIGVRVSAVAVFAKVERLTFNAQLNAEMRECGGIFCLLTSDFCLSSVAVSAKEEPLTSDLCPLSSDLAGRELGAREGEGVEFLVVLVA